MSNYVRLLHSYGELKIQEFKKKKLSKLKDHQYKFMTPKKKKIRAKTLKYYSEVRIKKQNIL